MRAYSVDCLRDLGYRVVEAHDGPTALRVLGRSEQPPDLLFTDVVMPGMSGRELVDEARKLFPKLKVLYTSGYTRNAIVHGGRLDAGVELIAKPFSPVALGQKVRDVLDAGTTKRVLLVEGDATIRLLACEALADNGFVAEEAANAVEALGKVRVSQGHYHAVVIDCDLSDQVGEMLANEIRALYADLPVVLLCDRPEILEDKYGTDRCTSVLAKPFRVSALKDTLNDVAASCQIAHQVED